ncbi:unnamed protein product [Rotaria magnacalcarata]|uniref:Uncharacterized protein n=2 Tax=Rotaria magnacalcarata TaxID=392030 RepID=A0A816VV87_9BILA|nr:unnamed protein product [Rotaria magnacalcarata]CAF1642865.1 unnamed protein product [Rotaria magnacalcarata]CAF2124906.1 unnamed protein product [Rotaria magnacalcarata]CAF3832958.1 unnamed protein product [Rotaria magnacalcarata]CAF3916129.1 unnamed protein product [Rotaria magnacalcarata]
MDQISTVARGFNRQSFHRQPLSNLRQIHAAPSNPKNQDSGISTSPSSAKSNQFLFQLSSQEPKSPIDTIQSKASVKETNSYSNGALYNYIQRERKAHTMAPLTRISGPSSSVKASMFANTTAPSDSQAMKSSILTQTTASTVADSHFQPAVETNDNVTDDNYENDEDDDDDEAPIIVTVRYDPEAGAPPPEDAIRQAVNNKLKGQSDKKKTHDPIIFDFINHGARPQISQQPINYEHVYFSHPNLSTTAPINHPQPCIPVSSQRKSQEQNLQLFQQQKQQQLLQRQQHERQLQLEQQQKKQLQLQRQHEWQLQLKQHQQQRKLQLNQEQECKLQLQRPQQQQPQQQQQQQQQQQDERKFQLQRLQQQQQQQQQQQRQDERKFQLERQEWELKLQRQEQQQREQERKFQLEQQRERERKFQLEQQRERERKFQLEQPQREQERKFQLEQQQREQERKFQLEQHQKWELQLQRQQQQQQQFERQRQEQLQRLQQELLKQQQKEKEQLQEFLQQQKQRKQQQQQVQVDEQQIYQQKYQQLLQQQNQQGLYQQQQQFYQQKQLHPSLPPVGPRPSRPNPSVRPAFVNRSSSLFLQNNNIHLVQPTPIMPISLRNSEQNSNIGVRPSPYRIISVSQPNSPVPTGASIFKTYGRKYIPSLFIPISSDMTTQQRPIPIINANTQNVQPHLPERPHTAPGSTDMFRPSSALDIPELSQENLRIMLNQIPSLRGSRFHIEYTESNSPDGYPIPLPNNDPNQQYPVPDIVDQLPSNIIRHVKSSDNLALKAALGSALQSETDAQRTYQSQPAISTFNGQSSTILRHTARPKQRVQNFRSETSSRLDSNSKTNSSEAETNAGEKDTVL